jgi:hypothetical protein
MISFGSWSVLTVDFLIVLYLSLGGVTLAALLHLVNAKWRYEVRGIAVSLASLFPLAFILLVILLAAGKETFPWLGSHEHMPGWHNYVFLVAREVGGMLVVIVLWRRFVKLQAVSDRSPEDFERFKGTALFIPVAYVLYGTMVAWDFEMTMIPGWHSAIYGMYHFVSNFHMLLAFMVTLIFALSRLDKLVKPMPEYIYNYFGQFMLAFTILYTYTFFAQYLVTWYGNLGFERNRIEGMELGDYSVLWWTFIILKFFIPFFSLALDWTRHTPGAIVAVACSIMLGTWIERYTWISGSYTSGHLPMWGWFDIVVTAVVAFAVYMILRGTLRRANLVQA